MQNIAIVSRTAPEVVRLIGTDRISITFRGLRDARSGDGDARVRMMLPPNEVASLWRRLHDLLTDEEKAQP